MLKGSGTLTVSSADREDSVEATLIRLKLALKELESAQAQALQGQHGKFKLVQAGTISVSKQKL